MGEHTTSRVCSIEGCGRKHAAHGYCLMHYKRLKKHGTVDYTWGGKEVGRSCQYCERPVIAREMCFRHYQMWHRHGDPLFSDKKKVDGLPPGEHKRRDYRMVTKLAEADLSAKSAKNPFTTKHDAPSNDNFRSKWLRDGRRQDRQWEHRKVAGAKPGEVVHHIDGNPLNNEKANLHIFKNAQDHAIAHRSLEKAAYALLSHGVVVFDQDSGVYILSESFLQSI